MGCAKVPLEKKIEIKTLLEVGFSQRRIAKTLGISKTCVSGVAQKVKQNLPLTNLPGQGRKMASTATDDRNLLRLCKKDRTKSSEELSAELVLSNGKKLSAPTVRHRLLNIGYKSYTAKRKPSRKPAQRKERLSFVKEHHYWFKEWNNIIWSDEAHFEVFNLKDRTYVRRLHTETNEPLIFLPKLQSGDGNVGVWGCISGGARGPLVMY
jgi:transposase